ncbi:ABC transporter substrate-binding protein [Jiella avicenniae]|uniref:ABC transporter substrate-binding protein n=1 Tax=Jiella avicenniae TaxID=2907202 RepID=A0A9X1T3K4_9HYPH|nr:ABC transporter substrate-binding protein [Jiella avicenniae]MCE7027701.1 ABC transporter substrate-binding protein [Jiella avicenniae]MCE7028743.1 ABC transporter substrate-binding protein [Jiella avicenniae]
MRSSAVVKSASVLLAIAASPAFADEPVTLEYWVYSDFAQGDALALQQTFISEFKEKHPNVTINISGRGDDDLTAGQIAGAASGTLPDVFMNGLSVGAQLVEVGALSNLYPLWMEMPQSYRDQFDEDALKSCMPKPEELYCLPYTGFGEIMFRNLTVLKEAGIDTAKPPKDWNEWYAQMQAVHEAGKYAVPDQTQVFNSVASTYAIVGGIDGWGIDFDAMKTKIDPATYQKVLQLFVDMAPLNSGTSRNDQSTKDLFITNQLAFHVVGPWVNPTYEQAAKESGLKYDFVLVPGMKEDQHGGIKSYEIVGVAPGEHQKIAFEFAAYITEKNQMARWAKLLSRYNANAEAMAEPDVAELPLIEKSVQAVKYAVDVMPPYFAGAYPNCYRSIVTDNAAMVADGDATPEEGAQELVEELNDCLAN